MKWFVRTSIFVQLALLKMLDLRRPIYKQTVAYGHFGRHDLDLPWEKQIKPIHFVKKH
ncbi:methionine adenosyltransferase domain-containing protein [Bacillus sp. SL00103]